ncbi:MAG: DUF262 domain-containing protein [Candidatus Electrothrix sp. Rat3]|nr:DUF262 domain-containing protein [Candidatus Electrothrix rattekaaiensis]
MNFNTANNTFRQLMGDGLLYQVPAFQRDHSWSADERDDLWQDLLALHKKKSSCKRRIPRCNGRNSSRSGGNHPEAGERGSGAGRTHPGAGKNHSVAGENGSVALQRRFFRLHRLIFPGNRPSTQSRRTPCLPRTILSKLARSVT